MSRLSCRPPIAQDDTDVVERGQDVPWFIEQIEPYGFVLSFKDSSSTDENDRWQVKDRLDTHRVLAVQIGRSRPRLIHFMGQFDAAESAIRGASVTVLVAFTKGFPENWSEIWPRPPPPPPDALRRSKRLIVDDNNVEEKEEEEEESIAARRPKRTKQSDDSLCGSFYNEDAMLLRALRKAEANSLIEVLGLHEEDLSDDEMSDNCDEDQMAKWTKEEVEAFNHARLLLNPMSADFWQKMSAEFVETRTAEECQLRWIYESDSSGASKRGSRTKCESGFSEEDAMKRTEKAAKMGTAKFRKQVRNDWERVQVKQQRDNLATPFRDKMAGNKLPTHAGFSDVKTPMQTFAFGKDVGKVRRRLLAIDESGEDVDTDREEKSEDAPSPDVLVSINRDNLDGYLVGLVKEKKRLQNFQSRHAAKIGNYGNNIVTSRVQRITTETEAALAGVQGRMTPGGTVKLAFDRTNEEDNMEEKQDDDDNDSIW